MKFAITNGEIIFLHEHTYDRIPAWRSLAAQGKIRCPRCGDALSLIAPIRTDPFFAHTTRSDCPFQGMDQPPDLPAPLEAAAMLEERAPEDAVTVGSFRLPQRRSIGIIDDHGQRPQSTGYRERLRPKHAIPFWTVHQEAALHPEQMRAVHTTEGPLLILAGAGSGKTRVMTARTAHLVGEKGVDPRTIMVVTFTSKAAEEMKQRLALQLTRQQTAALISGTFHSIFYRILTHHQPDRWDQRRLLKHHWQKRRLLQESGLLRQADVPLAKEAELDEALDVISRWKNEYLLPARIASLSFDNEEERRAQALYPL
jgi:DNA helicase-2/ATP-dependent DNA helicase PcrA